MASSNHISPAVVVTVIITFTCLAWIVALLRLYTRIVLVKSGHGKDDYFVVAAVIFSTAVTVSMSQQVRYGMGKHWGGLADNEKVSFMTWFWASVWIYYGGLCLVKTSILLQYLRVFPSKKFRIVAYTLMAVIVTYSMCTMFAAMFICTPIQHLWNPEIDGTCLNTSAVWFSNTVLNIVTDIATTVLPLPVLRTLQLPKRQKILLMLVFGLGFTTCLISVLRLHSLYIASKTKDLSWDNPMPAIWSSTELNVAILCSCLPTLKGLISRIWPRLLSSGRYGSRQTHSLGRVSGHANNHHHSLQAQRPWEEELKSPRYDHHAYNNNPMSPQREQSTFLETDSEASVPSSQQRMHAPMHYPSQKLAEASVEERNSTPTLTRGEDMRYMLRNPTYKV